MTDASEQATAAFVGRLFEAGVQTMEVFTVYLGDRSQSHLVLDFTIGNRVYDISHLGPVGPVNIGT